MERKYCFMAVLAICAVMCVAMPVMADVHYVDAARPDDSGSGLSWATAEKTIGAALTASASGDAIWVKAGTYTEAITLKEGVSLYGGFEGDEIYLEDRDFGANVSTIDAQNSTVSVVTRNSGMGTCLIDGFTITHGSNFGINASGNLTITHNIITYNGTSMAFVGAGIMVSNGIYLIANNVIANTNAGSVGAGIWVSDCSPTITNNTIVWNYGPHPTSSGVYLAGTSSPSIKNNVIFWNSSNGIRNGGGYAVTVDYNCVNGHTTNYYNVTPGANDIQDNPWLIGMGDWHLSSYSPCIDAGDNNAAGRGSLDIDYQGRTIGDFVDMGADESDY